jgi:hypothetical protein
MNRPVRADERWLSEGELSIEERIIGSIGFFEHEPSAPHGQAFSPQRF